MIPIAVNGTSAIVQTAAEVSDGYGVAREWTDAFTVFASIFPVGSSQAPTEDGMEPAEQYRIRFCCPKGKTVRMDDRLKVGDVVYRLSSVVDYRGDICALGVRL